MPEAHGGITNMGPTIHAVFLVTFPLRNGGVPL
jgi:hypothetical protein